MREGESVICPGCKAQSRAKLHLVMEDWSVKRKELICPFCNFVLGEVKDGDQPEKEEKKSSSRLAALLGDDVEMDNVSALTAAPGDEKVCRRCRHLAVHPFKTVCLITQREVDLMGDCDQFEKRDAKKDEK